MMAIIKTGNPIKPYFVVSKWIVQDMKSLEKYLLGVLWYNINYFISPTPVLFSLNFFSAINSQ